MEHNRNRNRIVVPDSGQTTKTVTGWVEKGVVAGTLPLPTVPPPPMPTASPPTPPAPTVTTPTNTAP